jgi:hypothetical protein
MSEPETTPTGTTADEDVKYSSNGVALEWDDDAPIEEVDHEEGIAEAQRESAPQRQEAEEAQEGDEGEPEPAQEPEPEAKKYAGEFETVEEMESKYLHLKTKLGKQGNELGEIRERMARLEGRREAGGETDTPGAEGGDEVQTLLNREAEALAKDLIEQQGLSRQEAIRVATSSIERTYNVTRGLLKPVTAVTEQHARQRRLYTKAVELSSEADDAGKLLRPDWKDVIESPDFKAVGDAHPHLLDVDGTPDGLGLAYELAKSRMAARTAQEAAAAATGVATEQVATKMRASMAPGSASSAKGSKPADDDPDMPSSRNSLHPSMGGEINYR